MCDLADALALYQKPVLCVVDNGGDQQIALIRSIGVSSGLYIDTFYKSWINAKPLTDLDFVVIGKNMLDV